MQRTDDRNWKAYVRLDHRRLAGKYVVLVRGKLLAAGLDLERYVRKARKEFPDDIPFVAKVLDPRKTYIFGGGRGP